MIQVKLASPEQFVEDDIQSDILSLPDELLIHILQYSFLGNHSFIKLTLVCRRFHAIVQRPFNPWWRCMHFVLNQQKTSSALRQLRKIAASVHRLSLVMSISLAQHIELSESLLTSLTSLSLRWYDGCEPLIGSFARIGSATPNLEELFLECTPELGDEHMRLIKLYWPCLKVLSLAYCEKLTDEGFATHFLTPERSNLLHTINLEGNFRITDCAVEKLCLTHGASLRNVMLDAESLTDDAIDHLSNLQLASLCLNHCESLTDASCQSLLKLSPTLKHLHLIKAKELSAVAVKTLFDVNRGLANLEYLSLSECWNFNDACSSALSKCCVNLKALSLAWCFSCSEATLSSITRRLHKLELLDIQGLDMITGKSFQDVPDRMCRNLLYLCAAGCNNADDVILIDLVRRSKGQVTVTDYHNSMYNLLWLDYVTMPRAAQIVATTQNEHLLLARVDNQEMVPRAQEESDNLDTEDDDRPTTSEPDTTNRRRLSAHAIKCSKSSSSTYPRLLYRLIDVCAIAELPPDGHVTSPDHMTLRNYDDLALATLRRQHGACCVPNLIASLMTPQRLEPFIRPFR